ncbi:unnamed protein product [Schistosoma rodhaini]|uniref:Saposin B-type domain-containing protein n=2 Tax=Schistosoma rodhaini TaxID=6188 RepID=A0AA85FL56_9TREM|nr:unnamed protein product [Schistosoma rodhaini]
MLLSLSTLMLIIINVEVNNVKSEEYAQMSILNTDQPDCHFLCELCTSTVNATKFILDNEPFIPEILKNFMPICYMLPKLQYRKICYHFVNGGAVDLIHELVNTINENNFCFHLGLCSSTIPCPSFQKTLTYNNMST